MGVGDQQQQQQPPRLRGAAAWRLHLTLAIGLAVCISAFVIEVARALGGNTLSWAYVFEWPILGGFGIYMWWKLFNQSPTSKPPKASDVDPADEAALAAWNRYLAELAQQDRLDGDDPTH